jgi:hypothetical protein
MSAVYPVFERPLPNSDGFNGNSLSRCLTQLDEIAAIAKVTPLSRFIDSATMAYEALDEEQLAAMAVPAVKWIQPEDGLLTLRGIMDKIRVGKIPFHSRRGDDTEGVLTDLIQLENLLLSAVEEANRFHLLVDM